MGTKGWVAVLGAVATIITIFVFVTGIPSIPDFVEKHSDSITNQVEGETTPGLAMNAATDTIGLSPSSFTDADDGDIESLPIPTRNSGNTGNNSISASPTSAPNYAGADGGLDEMRSYTKTSQDSLGAGNSIIITEINYMTGGLDEGTYIITSFTVEYNLAYESSAEIAIHIYDGDESWITFENLHNVEITKGTGQYVFSGYFIVQGVCEFQAYIHPASPRGDTWSPYAFSEPVMVSPPITH